MRLRLSLARPLIFLGLLLAMVSGASHGQFGGPQAVRVATAEIREITGEARVAGTVISDEDARLSLEVGGVLASIARPGTRVSQGEELARIDDRELALRRDELQASLERIEAREQFLASESLRLARLAASSNTSERELGQIRADYQATRAEKRMMQAQLSTAELNLERTRLLAPFDGVVSERLRQRGERISAGTEVLRLTNPATLEVVARVPLRHLRWLEVGQMLALQLDGQPDAPSEGRLSSIIATGDAQSRLFEIRVELPAHSLPVGLPVSVSVPTSAPAPRLAVPRDSLVLRRNDIYVFRVGEDGRAERISVTLDEGSGAWIGVDGDLNAGDQVVVRGNERLQPGAELRILD